MCCVGLVAVPSGVAHAAGIDLTCLNTSGTLNFLPSLEFRNQTVSGSLAGGHTSGCSSPDGSQPALASATISAPLSGSSFCLVINLEGVATLTWNNGTTSTLNVTASTDPLSGVIGLGGVVTAGPMAGDSLLVVPVLESINGLCVFGGVTGINFNEAILAFTSL
jgi:hypothetical protein